MSNIFIPGVGELTPEALRCHRAVYTYDERLYFAKHPQNHDWCVFIKMPHGEPDRPVLGFGYECPHPDHVMTKLVDSDTLRHGREWLEKKVREKNRILKKRYEYQADQAAGDTAERLEHALRGMGKSPVVKSLSKEPNKK